MMQITSLQQQKGQGIMEVLFVTFLIMLSTLALIKFQTSIAYNNSLSLQQSLATSLASSQIETLHDYSVQNTQSGYTAFQDLVSSTGSTQKTQTIGNTVYTITWTVTNTLPTTPSTASTGNGKNYGLYYDDYDTVNVTVTWTDSHNMSQTVNLSSQVAALQPGWSALLLMYGPIWRYCLNLPFGNGGTGYWNGCLFPVPNTTQPW